MRSMNPIKLGKNRALVQCLYRPSLLLRGWVVLVNGGRYSWKIMSISVHKLFNISLGLEPTSLNPTQDMQIVLLSISHRALCPLAANHFLHTGNVRVSSNAGVDDGRRKCSISCTVFWIVWLSSLGREISYLNLDILCFSSVHAKNCDFSLNIHHDRFLPHAFQFTIHYSFNVIYFDLLRVLLNKSYIT
jgi:hypothetical protein